MARILIVDDSLLARHTHSNIIRDLGHEIATAENGLQALEMVLREQYDAVLVDMMMPVMDGVGFLRALKEKQIELLTVVLSADIQESKRQECLDLGARCFLGKPATAQKISDLFTEILAQ